MSGITIAWSMAGSACAMLAMLHAIFWLKDRRNTSYLLSALTALSAAAVTMSDLALAKVESVETYRIVLIWQTNAIFAMLVLLVWFLRKYSRFARGWLAVLITLLWTSAIIVNLVSPHSLAFSELVDLRRVHTPWGEQFSLPVGTTNPLKWLADLASVLIVAYVLDAAIRHWRAGERRPAATIGVGIGGFIVAAGIHTPLVDAGVIRTPYMLGFAFLAIVSVLSYELVGDAVRSSVLTREVQASEKRWRSLLECLPLVVIRFDRRGFADYVNPFFETLTGKRREEILGRSWTELTVPGASQIATNPLETLTDDLTLWRGQSLLRCADENSRTISWSSVRLVDSESAF